MIRAIRPEEVVMPPPFFSDIVIEYINKQLLEHFLKPSHSDFWYFKENNFLTWLEQQRHIYYDKFVEQGVCLDSVYKTYTEAGWIVSMPCMTIVLLSIGKLPK